MPGRDCHSLHAYFLRPGDPAVPILYEVDRSRELKAKAEKLPFVHWKTPNVYLPAPRNFGE